MIARTAGNGALARLPTGSPPLRVFLARVSDADSITSPSDRRLLALGRLRIDRQGNGSLRFTVPDVPSGRYTTLTHCAACAASSGGRALLPTGPFSGSFVVARTSGGRVPLAPVLIGAALAVGAIAWPMWSRTHAGRFGAR